MKTPRPTVLILFFLLVTIMTAYAPVLNNGFVHFDDDNYVTGNPHVLSGLTFENIRWAFTTTSFAYYHPVTWLSHMLDVQIFGTNSAGHHLTSLALHMLNAVLLFFFFTSLVRNRWISAVLAVLWACHPLRVESVAWIAERKDLLCGSFWLSALLAYGWYVKKPSSKRYCTVLTFFIFGLLSKPMIVTLPFVMLLMDIWPYRRIRPYNSLAADGILFHMAVIEKVPFLLLSIIACILTLNSQGAESAVVALSSYPFPLRMSNAVTAYTVYVLKFFLPVDLTTLYPYPAFSHGWQVLAAVLALATIAFICIITRKRHPFITVGSLWFGGSLVPVIGLVQAGVQAYADRFTYIPSIGIYLVLLFFLTRHISAGTGIRNRWIAFGCIILAISCILSNIQIRRWHDTITLFSHALSVTHGNYVAHNNLGIGLLEENRIREARIHFVKALEIYPGYMEAMHNMGFAYEKEKKPDSAITWYKRVVERNPLHAPGWVSLGSIYQSNGDIQLAINAYRHAIAIDKHNYNVYNDLGVLYFRSGNVQEALDCFGISMRIDPARTDAPLNRARVNLSAGNREEALHDLRFIVSHHPGDTGVRSSVSAILRTHGLANFDREL